MSPLLLGAGGFLGLNLVDVLQRLGQPVRCATRRAAPRMALRRRRVALVHADLDRPDTLVAAMQGARLVFHLAGHYPALSLDRPATVTRGCRQMRAVLDAAASAGVRRLVYVSSTATVAPGASASTEADTFAAPPGLGVYHDLKWAMERLACEETRLEVIVACPGACLGPWDQRLGTSAPLIALARGQRPRLPDGVLNLVDVRDAALGIARLGLASRPPRRVLLVGHDVALLPFLERLAERYGVPGPIALAPGEARRLANAAERRVAREGRGRPELSRELVDLILAGGPVDASLSRRSLRLAYRPLPETLASFEAWSRRGEAPPIRIDAVAAYPS